MTNARIPGQATRNWYFIVVGVLFVLFSVTHELNGRESLFPKLADLEVSTRTSVFYVWHVITAENLLFGLVLVALGFRAASSAGRLTARVFAAMLVARWVVIEGSTLVHNPQSLPGTWMDTVAIFLCVALLVRGSSNARGPVPPMVMAAVTPAP
jgi:hypothetical protein